MGECRNFYRLVWLADRLNCVFPTNWAVMSSARRFEIRRIPHNPQLPPWVPVEGNAGLAWTMASWNDHPCALSRRSPQVAPSCSKLLLEQKRTRVCQEVNKAGNATKVPSPVTSGLLYALWLARRDATPCLSLEAAQHVSPDVSLLLEVTSSLVLLLQSNWLKPAPLRESFGVSTQRSPARLHTSITSWFRLTKTNIGQNKTCKTKTTWDTTPHLYSLLLHA